MAFEEENGDSEKENEKEGARRRERERKSERCGPRQRDIVQIAESGDIDHRGAAAAEPSGTDTSDLSIPLESLPLPVLSLSLSSLIFCSVRKDEIPFRHIVLHIKKSVSFESPNFWNFITSNLRYQLTYLSFIMCISIWATSMHVYLFLCDL